MSRNSAARAARWGARKGDADFTAVTQIAERMKRALAKLADAKCFLPAVSSCCQKLCASPARATRSSPYAPRRGATVSPRTRPTSVRCFGHRGGAPGMDGDLQICESGYTIVVLSNLDPPAAQRISEFIRQRLPAKT
jgi:hypothetical protein